MREGDLEELQRLWELKEKGAISEEEYRQLKAEVLKAAPPPPPPPKPAAPTPTKAPARVAASSANWKTNYAGIGIVVVVLVFMVIVAIGASQPSNDGNSPVENTQADAKAVSPPPSPKERKWQVEKILAELKRTPASNVARHNELFSKLFELDPANPEFERMRDNYQNKIAAQHVASVDPDVDVPEFDAHPAEALSITNFRGTKEGFGTRLTVSFTVKNAAPFAIKDFEVTCLHSAPSGTQIDSNVRTIYEIVPAHGSKSIHGFDMGLIAAQATRTSCSVTDAVKA